jgi:hypothetical protein
VEDIEAEFNMPLSQDKIQDRTQNTSHCSSQLTRKRKTTKRVVEGGSSDASLSADSEGGNPSTMAAAPAIMSSITGISGLSDLLLQFPSDILQLVPKPKSAAEESWFLLHKAEVAQAKIDIFQSLNILRVFHRAQCTVLDSAD